MTARAVAILFLGLVLAAGASAPAKADPLKDVDVFMGTGVGAPDFGTGGGSGATFPGASLPFGMVQFSPDTFPSTGNFAGGYTYSDTELRGFSLNHFSGAGCAIFQDLPILPTVAPVTVSPDKAGSSDLQARYVPRFNHANESAGPGLYRVALNPGTRSEIRAALTTTTRTADARFTFPPTASSSLLFNVGGSAMADFAASVHVDPAHHEVYGSATSGSFCYQPTKYTIYFVARFARSFAAHGTWVKQQLRPRADAVADSNPAASNYKPIPGGPPAEPGDPSSTAQAGAYVTFNTHTDRTVDVQIGVSYTSIAGARRNLQAEAAHHSFAVIAAAARRAWRAQLDRIAVGGGTRTERTLFYTSLYHALLEPNTFSDVDGRYRGMDGRIHRARGFTMMSNVSGWDIYRTQVPLLSMLDPARASDLVRSLDADAQQSGCFPRWPYADQQTNIMVGDPSDPITADAYAFGARSFDLRATVSALIGDASRPCQTTNGDYTEREALAAYLRLGYVPFELNTDSTGHTIGERSSPWGSAATTLEYATADFALSRLADAAGKHESARQLLARSAAWRHLLDPASGYIEPRYSTGAWLPAFDPDSGEGFVEGDGAQYTWSVPQDSAGLIAALGGRENVRRRLNAYFAQLNAGPNQPHAYLGDEPTIGEPWLYDWAGAPAATSDVVHRALSTLYAPTPAGMPGNDDGGTMSSWWILAALGLYPAVPGTDILALNAPLFPAVTLRLPNGTVNVHTSGEGSGTRYIRALRVSGRAWPRTWVRFAQLQHGGELDFSLTGNPRTRWGTAASDAPPSYPPSKP